MSEFEPGGGDNPPRTGRIDLTKERLATLSLELTVSGFDLKRLGFFRWMVQNDMNPELISQEPAHNTSVSVRNLLR